MFETANSAVTPTLSGVFVETDRTAPSLTSTNPADGTILTNFSSLVFNLQDNVSVDESGTSIIATLNETNLTNFSRDNTVANQITLTLNNPNAPGTYVFRITPRDLAGNLGSQSTVTITVPQPPLQAVTTPSATQPTARPHLANQFSISTEETMPAELILEDTESPATRITTLPRDEADRALAEQEQGWLRFLDWRVVVPAVLLPSLSYAVYLVFRMRRGDTNQ